MLLNRLVLVLNASYEGIDIVSAKRALTLVLGGKAVVEELSASSIRTARLKLRLPSVIRLLSYRRIPPAERFALASSADKDQTATRANFHVSVPFIGS